MVVLKTSQQQQQHKQKKILQNYVPMIRSRLLQQYCKHIRKCSFKSQNCFTALVVAEFKPSSRAFSILVKMSSEKKVDKTPEKRKCLPRQLLDEIRGNKVTRSYTKEAEKNWRGMSCFSPNN